MRMGVLVPARPRYHARARESPARQAPCTQLDTFASLQAVQPVL
jgi:hypothetical protein